MARGLFRFCPIQKRVVPADEVMVEVPANVAHGIIPDEMPPTRSPLDGKFYTSKARLRETYRAAGVVEVGNEYENGFDPGKGERESRAALRSVMAQIRERMNG